MAKNLKPDGLGRAGVALDLGGEGKGRRSNGSYRSSPRAAKRYRLRRAGIAGVVGGMDQLSLAPE